MRLAKPVAAAFAAVFIQPGIAVAADASTYTTEIVEELVEDGPALIEGEIEVEVQNDYTFDADDPDAELNDLFAVIEGAFTLNLTDFFSISTALVVEPVRDPGPGEDRVFEDHGLYAETLSVAVTIDRLTAFAGKINPSFGIAWDAAPGIYGADFAEDYELTERIGGGVEIDLGFGAGEHVLTANAFFADTTFLSRSVFTDRGRTRLSDGGPNNTESLESFSLTLDGSDLPSLPGVAYHIGLRRQARGVGNPSSETGIVAGIVKEFELADDQVIEMIAEAAYFGNFDADANDRFYATLGGAYIRGPWNAAISYTLRDISGGGAGTNFADHLLQVSAGREVAYGVTLDVGYKYAREGDVDSHTVGFLLARAFDVSVR
jgi:hypothetical protein